MLCHPGYQSVQCDKGWISNQLVRIDTLPQSGYQRVQCGNRWLSGTSEEWIISSWRLSPTRSRKRADGKENFSEFALVLKLNRVPVMAFIRKGQFYSKKYAEEFSFISSSAKSKQHAYCKNCRRDLSVAHGGHSDIVRHVKSALHLPLQIGIL